MSMFDMLQKCPQQWEALMKTLDHTKTPQNMNTISQKIVPQQVNTLEAMATMFKDKVEVPPFLLSIWIYGKNLHNCLIDSRALCNVMPLSIAQRLGVNP
jgi:phage terminase large subunit GpA-like protein